MRLFSQVRDIEPCLKQNSPYLEWFYMYYKDKYCGITSFETSEILIILIFADLAILCILLNTVSYIQIAFGLIFLFPHLVLLYFLNYRRKILEKRMYDKLIANMR